MNKKYFDTKPNTVEQSVLGVWRNAVDEAESRKLDGRTKGYKEHRTKLEAQRARLKKEDVEEKVDHQLKIAIDTVKNPNKGKFLGGPSAKEAEKTLRTKYKYTDKMIAKLKEEIELYEIKNGKIHISKANFRKVHKDYKNSTKGKERMMALDPKSGATTSFEVVFEEVELDEATPDYVEINKSNVIQEAQSGDKEAYQKFFNSVLKKFKVKSPAELDDAKKKEFFNYVDKNWKGSDEKAEKFIRNIKKESTNKTFKQMWEEGLDARTREYKNHRTKLETKRLRHEKVQSEQEKDDKAKKGVNIKVDPVIKDTRKY